MGVLVIQIDLPENCGLVVDTLSPQPRTCANSAGLTGPSGWPATWSASATMAANIGADSLVPQDAVQPPCPPVNVSKTFTATLHDALIEMSGMPRWLPVTFRTPF